MAFSYDSSLSDVKDKLRFLVQDTRDAGHFLEDEEIIFVSGDEPNLYRAAAALCRIIAANINSLPGFNDKQIFDPEGKSAEYRKLADDFDKKASQKAGLSLSPGSISANVAIPPGKRTDPAFTRDLHQDSIN